VVRGDDGFMIPWPASRLIVLYDLLHFSDGSPLDCCIVTTS
jgi:hypothetical protein